MQLAQRPSWDDSKPEHRICICSQIPPDKPTGPPMISLIPYVSDNTGMRLQCVVAAQVADDTVAVGGTCTWVLAEDRPCRLDYTLDDQCAGSMLPLVIEQVQADICRSCNIFISIFTKEVSKKVRCTCVERL